ncbi:MAG: hypothetical protein LW878_04635 [Proteobacteria bacterium]|nr:hypothetical protein [Pseudomonadota bacterium]
MLLLLSVLALFCNLYNCQIIDSKVSEVLDSLVSGTSYKSVVISTTFEEGTYLNAAAVCGGGGGTGVTSFIIGSPESLFTSLPAAGGFVLH